MKSSIPVLNLSHKLYGREREIALLMSAYDRVRHGATEAFFVSGNPGIGKTALIQEIRNSIQGQNSSFISGKYDQLNKDMPYSAVIQAFRELVTQLLTERQEEALCLRKRILQAVGANGRIIIDVIPQIERIIGAQPAVSYTDPTESQNRFNRVMQKFVGVFAREEQPLVLFLDDLQWVDQASLHLIKVLISDPESKHLLLIGAFRDTEVGAAHPFRSMVDELTKTGVSITATKLPPLQVQHVNTLIADLIVNASRGANTVPTHPLALLVDDLTQAGIPITSAALPPLEAGQVNTFIAGALGCPSEQTEQLARIIFRKTRGNPLFIGQMMKTLYEEKKLVYETKSGWQWNAEEIEQLHVADSVVDLLVSKIHKLSLDTQTVLKFAACIGNRFDLETLAVINGKSQGLTLIDISPALQEALVIPLHAGYVFFHDRIQEAAYSLLSDNEKQEVHCLIGYFVLSRTAPENRNEKIFYIVDQLNLGAERIATAPKRLELAVLNLMAGKKAKASTAFGAAAKYLSKGIALLPEDGWAAQYDLTLALHMECSECLYLSGDFERAEKQFEVILGNAKTSLEKAEVYNMLVQLSQNRGKPLDAVSYGCRGLRQLGLNLPLKPSKLTLIMELAKVRWRLGGRTAAELACTLQVPDPKSEAVADFLTNIAPAAYYYDKIFASIVALKMFTTIQNNAHSLSAPLAYVMYGFISCIASEEYRKGHEFGKMSIKLSERNASLSLKAQCNFLFSGFVNHWRQPLKTSVDYLVDGHKYGLESGNFVYAGYCAGVHTVTSFFKGDNLDAVEAQSERYLEVFRRLQLKDMFLAITCVQRMIFCLKRLKKTPSHFSDANFDEADLVKQLRIEGFQFVFCLYQVFKLPLFYFFDEHESALETSISLHKNRDHLLGMYYLPHHNFYYSLTLAALYPSASLIDKWSYWRTLKKNQKQMHIWAENCPENFLNKHTLVAAEMARVRGEHAEAENLYDQAIILSRDNEFIQEQAIANELAGKYYLSRADETRARSYLQEARRCYEQWGAVAKVKHLEQKYPDLLA